MMIGVLMLFLWIKYGRPTPGRHSTNFISLGSFAWMVISIVLIVAGYVVIAAG